MQSKNLSKEVTITTIDLITQMILNTSVGQKTIAIELYQALSLYHQRL